MREPYAPKTKSSGLRVIAIAAAGMLLSLGICKAGSLTDRNAGCCGPSGLDVFGGFGFILFSIGLAIGVLMSIFEALFGHRGKDSH